MRNWVIKNFNIETKEGDVYLKLTALDTFSNKWKNLTGATWIKLTNFIKVEDFTELMKNPKLEKDMKMQIMDILKIWDWVFSIKDELESKMKTLFSKENKKNKEQSLEEFVKEKWDILALSPEDTEEESCIVEMYSSDNKKVLRILGKKLAESWKEKILFTGAHTVCLKKLQEIERIRVDLDEFVIMSNDIEIFPWLKSKIISLDLEFLWDVSEGDNEDTEWFYSYKNKKQDVKYKYLHFIKAQEVFNVIIEPELKRIESLWRTYNKEWEAKNEFNLWTIDLKDTLKNVLTKTLLNSWNNVWIDNLNYVEDSLFRKYDNFKFKVGKIFKFNRDEIRLQVLSIKLQEFIANFFMNNKIFMSMDLTWDIIHFLEKEKYNLFLKVNNSYWSEFRELLLKEQAFDDYDKAIGGLEIQNVLTIQDYLIEHVKFKIPEITDKKAKEFVEDAWQYNSSSISGSIWSKLSEIISNYKYLIK